MNAYPADPPGLDLARLHRYLDEALPELVRGPLTATLIEGGRSNLTYDITDGQGSWVVRRPPLGHVLATAHDMAREFRVISALGPTAVPVPVALAHCADPDVIGAPFYVMEKVHGTVYRTAQQTATLGVERATALAHALIDVLADLHGLDPATVGLADFGRPDGFLERQLRRWRKQLVASRSRPLPGIDELYLQLATGIPATATSGVVHGDYRLDNLIVGDEDRIVAVLDWEMSTLGDPLTDLGLLLVYWDGLATLPGNGIIGAVERGSGFPRGEALTRRYADRRGVDLPGLTWYVGLGLFKIAVILEGIHYRYVAGQTIGAGFEHIGELVPALVTLGHEAMGDL